MTPVRIPKKAADLLMLHDRELKAATARFNDAIAILAATLDGVGEGWQIRVAPDGTMEFFDPETVEQPGAPKGPHEDSPTLAGEG